MEVIILAAGYGTRLYPLTRNVSKSLLPLGKKTILDFLIAKVKALDIDGITVVTNNKFYQDFLAWEDKQAFSVRIINDRTNNPEERLGAIGDVEFALNQANIQDDVLILGGDNLFDWDLARFLIFAKKVNHPVVGLYDVQDLEKAKRFGITRVDSENKIVDFKEKPQNPESTLAGTCLYFFPKKDIQFVHQYVRERNDTDTTGDYICWLMDKTDVYGCVFEGIWLDVGHKDTLKEAERLFKEFCR